VGDELAAKARTLPPATRCSFFDRFCRTRTLAGGCPTFDSFDKPIRIAILGFTHFLLIAYHYAPIR